MENDTERSERCYMRTQENNQNTFSDVYRALTQSNRKILELEQRIKTMEAQKKILTRCLLVALGLDEEEED